MLGTKNWEADPAQVVSQLTNTASLATNALFYKDFEPRSISELRKINETEQLIGGCCGYPF